MTLEEARVKIAEKKDMCDSIANEYKNRYNPAEEYHKGVACGLNEALSILEEVESEHVGNSGKMTLVAFAKKLNDFIAFNYLTCEKEKYCRDAIVRLHWEKPIWVGGGIRRWFTGNNEQETAGELAILPIFLDLSEYADADGNINYSKCIVEVDE